MSRDSIRDAVTQLYSRAHLLRRLQELTAKCDRQKEKLAVILWDIEGFGEFNNQFGQGEGDDVLRHVAEAIRQSLRVYDEAFRLGGDVFCALVVPAEEGWTKDVSERVKKIVAQNLFQKGTRYGDHGFALVSGYVFYPGGDIKGAEPLLHAAEQELYKKKRMRA